jgi:hypothetical protein
MLIICRRIKTAMSRGLRSFWRRNSQSLPDYNLHDRNAFLDIISKPRPFKDLECHDVQITLMGGVALVHARMTLKTLSGVVKHGRYTDEYLRRDEKWWCLGANVISENITA